MYSSITRFIDVLIDVLIDCLVCRSPLVYRNDRESLHRDESKAKAGGGSNMRYTDA